MPKSATILAPSNYVAPSALGFSDADGGFALVTPTAPLPVIVANSEPAPTTPVPAPLGGNTSKSTSVGPFSPVADQPIHLQLSGTWTGRVTLERSIDQGKTRQALTIGGMSWAAFTANANEPVWQEAEAGATFYLNIALQSGSLTYRMSQ